MNAQPITTNHGSNHNTQLLDVLQLEDALLRLRTVSQATGLSNATVYRKLAAGEFPKPVRLGCRCTRWKAADVRAWIQAQGRSIVATEETARSTADLAKELGVDLADLERALGLDR